MAKLLIAGKMTVFRSIKCIAINWYYSKLRAESSTVPIISPRKYIYLKRTSCYELFSTDPNNLSLYNLINNDNVMIFVYFVTRGAQKELALFCTHNGDVQTQIALQSHLMHKLTVDRYHFWRGSTITRGK